MGGANNKVCHPHAPARIYICQAAEKALEELEDMYGDALHGRKNYDPNLLRDYGHHVRWKVQKVLPDRFGEPKNRTGVEISDGSLKIVWETGSEDAS